MQTTIRYNYEYGNAVWPIPFDFAADSEVGANLVNPSGVETPLEQGRDFIVSDGAVICVIPRGCAIVIYRNLNLTMSQAALRTRSLMRASQQSLAEQALAELNQATALATAQATVQAAAQPVVQTADDGRIAALEARISGLEDEKLALLEAARAREADSQIQKLSSAGQLQAALLSEAAAQKVDEAVASIGGAAQSATSQSLEQLEQAASQAEKAAQEALESARQAQEAANAASVAVEEATARLAAATAAFEEAAASLESRAQAAAGDASGQIARAGAQAMDSISRQAAETARASQRQASLDGQAWPATGYLEMDADLPAGALLALPEPLAYYPGRSSLAVARNGLVLTPGLDFEEAGSQTAPSNVIRLASGARVGDVWSFWIAPTNAAQAAGKYAKDAAASAHEAAARAEAAGLAAERAVNGSNDALGRAALAAQTADRSASVATSGADRAFELAACAWRAAVQASLDNARPGIAAIPHLAALDSRPSGVYFVLPGAPGSSPFMGIWPLEDPQQAPFDGVFFTGVPYGTPPDLPDDLPYPEKPSEDPGMLPPILSRPGDDWLPCGHRHGE